MGRVRDCPSPFPGKKSGETLVGGGVFVGEQSFDQDHQRGEGEVGIRIGGAVLLLLLPLMGGKHLAGFLM